MWYGVCALFQRGDFPTNTDSRRREHCNEMSRARFGIILGDQCGMPPRSIHSPTGTNMSQRGAQCSSAPFSLLVQFPENPLRTNWGVRISWLAPKCVWPADAQPRGHAVAPLSRVQCGCVRRGWADTSVYLWRIPCYSRFMWIMARANVIF